MKKIKELFNKNRIVSSFIIVFVLLLLIMCIFWFSKKGTFGYDAQVGNIVIDCPKAVSGGQTVSCDVSLEMVNPITVYSVNANYNLNSDLTFGEFTNECTGEGNCFEIFQDTTDDEGPNGFAVLNADGVVDGGLLGTLTFTMPDHIDPNQEFEVGLKDISICFDSLGVETIVDVSDVTTTVRAGNNVATLRSLMIPDVDFDQQFDSLNFEYSATVPAEIIHIHFDYRTTSEGAQVSGSGIGNDEQIVDLAYGHNILELIVTSEDQSSSNTYTIDIYREYEFDTDAYIYIPRYNILYTGADSGEEIIQKLGDAPAGVRYDLDLDNSMLYVISDDEDEAVVAVIDIVRFGLDYSIVGDKFYLDKHVTYNDLVYSVVLPFYDDDNAVGISVYLYDDEGIEVTDLDATIRDEYYALLYAEGNIFLGYYLFEDTELEFDSSFVMDQENMIISRLEAGTTVLEFKDMITTSSNIIVRDSGGNKVDDYAVIATGYTATLDLDDETLVYTLSVLGDVNGDGELYLNDISMIYRYYVGSIIGETLVNLDLAQIYAADIILDGDIHLNDASRFYRFISGDPETTVLGVVEVDNHEED